MTMGHNIDIKMVGMVDIKSMGSSLGAAGGFSQEIYVGFTQSCDLLVG